MIPPATAAGAALIGDPSLHRGSCDPAGHGVASRCTCDAPLRVAAVELEATAAERTRLRRAVTEMRDGQRRVDELSGAFDWGYAKACARVLDLLDGDDER